MTLCFFDPRGSSSPALGPTHCLMISDLIRAALVLCTLFLTASPSHATCAGGESEPATKLDPVPRFEANDGKPWRLEQELGLPDWLSMWGEQRTRYEALDDRIGAGQMGSDQLWALRTILGATARYENFRVTAEMMDSRQYRAPDDAVLNTGIVNAGELLQAFVGYRVEDAFGKGNQLDLQLGRHTMDVGSRRLVARNRFRNTINGFSGLNAVWTSEAKESVRMFFVVPVQRLPRDQASLQSNDVQLDEEQDRSHFFGVHASTPDIGSGIAAEAYAFLLDEDDSRKIQTRNRQLWTLGARVQKKPKAGEYDFEWESALQLGEMRASASAADVTDLDHRAHFHHLSVGYRFDADGQPRLEALFDYASGDDDPTDGDSNRFDTLFGARRFEFGPTGIFGPFARANLITPGYRITFNPWSNVQVMLAHRFHYLASDQDAWTTSGLVDATGNSGRFIGQFAEGRVRVELVPKNLKLEFGLAQLFAGGFIDEAPNATGQGDTTYAYIGTTLSF